MQQWFGIVDNFKYVRIVRVVGLNKYYLVGFFCFSFVVLSSSNLISLVLLIPSLQFFVCIFPFVHQRLQSILDIQVPLLCILIVRVAISWDNFGSHGCSSFLHKVFVIKEWHVLFSIISITPFNIK